MKKLFLFTSLFLLLFLVACNTQVQDVMEEPKIDLVPNTPVVEETDVMEEIPADITQPMDEEVEETTDPMAPVEVAIVEKGFEPKEIEVKVGQEIIWDNTRSGNLKLAFLQGMRQCVEMRSGNLEPGDTFTWKFDKPQECTYLDAISKVYIGIITVVE